MAGQQSQLAQDSPHFYLQADRTMLLIQIDQVVLCVQCSSQGLNEHVLLRIISV